jgi:hypothetical protein
MGEGFGPLNEAPSILPRDVRPSHSFLCLGALPPVSSSAARPHPLCTTRGSGHSFFWDLRSDVRAAICTSSLRSPARKKPRQTTSMPAFFARRRASRPWHISSTRPSDLRFWGRRRRGGVCSRVRGDPEYRDGVPGIRRSRIGQPSSIECLSAVPGTLAGGSANQNQEPDRRTSHHRTRGLSLRRAKERGVGGPRGAGCQSRRSRSSRMGVSSQLGSMASGSATAASARRTSSSSARASRAARM